MPGGIKFSPTSALYAGQAGAPGAVSTTAAFAARTDTTTLWAAIDAPTLAAAVAANSSGADYISLVAAIDSKLVLTLRIGTGGYFRVQDEGQNAPTAYIAASALPSSGRLVMQLTYDSAQAVGSQFRVTCAVDGGASLLGAGAQSSAVTTGGMSASHSGNGVAAGSMLVAGRLTAAESASSAMVFQTVAVLTTAKSDVSILTTPVVGDANVLDLWDWHEGAGSTATGSKAGIVLALTQQTWGMAATPTITSVVLAPANTTAAIGTTVVYTGTATLSDATTRPVTSGDGQFSCSIGAFGGAFGVWTAPNAPATGTTTFVVPANSNTGQTLVTATTPVTVAGTRISNTAVGRVARTLVTMGRRDLRARFSERPVVRALLGPLNNAVIPVPPTPPASGRVLARSVTD